MSRARHKSNNPTKGVNMPDPAPSTVYAGGGSNVVKEAKARKKGGKVMGKTAKKRLDRKGRMSGGRCGADKAPLSSASKISAASGHKTPSGE